MNASQKVKQASACADGCRRQPRGLPDLGGEAVVSHLNGPTTALPFPYSCRRAARSQHASSHAAKPRRRQSFDAFRELPIAYPCTQSSEPRKPPCPPSNADLFRRRSNARRAIGRSPGARSGSATGNMCATARMRVVDAGPSRRPRRTKTRDAAHRATRRTKAIQPPCDHCRQSAPCSSPFP